MQAAGDWRRGSRVTREEWRNPNTDAGWRRVSPWNDSINGLKHGKFVRIPSSVSFTGDA